MNDRWVGVVYNRGILRGKKSGRGAGWGVSRAPGVTRLRARIRRSPKLTHGKGQVQEKTWEVVERFAPCMLSVEERVRRVCAALPWCGLRYHVFDD